MNRTHHGRRIRRCRRPLAIGWLTADVQTFLDQPAAQAELAAIARCAGCTPAQARSRVAALFATAPGPRHCVSEGGVS